MECKRAIRVLSEYLDDCLSWQEAQSLDQHLRACAHCAHEFHQIKAMRQVMRSLKRVEPPQDLGLRMKILASKQNGWLAAEKVISRMDDFLRPIAIPALSGVVLTFFFFVILLSIFFTGVNLNASDKDIPLGLVTEPRPRLIYMSQFVQLENFRSVKEPITVETDVRNDGTVRDYRVLKGPQDPATIRSLNQFLLFEAKIDPATVFGRRTEGKIIFSLSFFPTSNNTIDVQG